MDSSNTVETLNDLIETCKDGEYGFRSSAEHLRNADTQQLFLRHADECAVAAAELQDLVRQLGGKVENNGSLAGAVHRGWVAVKAKLAGSADKAILEAAEQGEDTAKERYHTALRESLPPQVRAMVERQYSGVLRNHAQVRALRDEARAVAGD
jgi:uncharacterized protein (TIGR02284 family)